MAMAIRRIAVEEAFATANVLEGWKSALARRDVEPGFAKMGANTLAPTPENEWAHNRLLISAPDARSRRRCTRCA